MKNDYWAEFDEQPEISMEELNGLEPDEVEQNCLEEIRLAAFFLGLDLLNNGDIENLPDDLLDGPL
jgi:hypothetical protein